MRYPGRIRHARAGRGAGKSRKPAMSVVQRLDLLCNIALQLVVGRTEIRLVVTQYRRAGKILSTERTDLVVQAGGSAGDALHPITDPRRYPIVSRGGYQLIASAALARYSGAPDWLHGQIELRAVAPT